MLAKTVDTNVNARVLGVLERLHSTCIASARGFTSAAGAAEGLEHREMLVRYARRRGEFADAIARGIEAIGGVVDPAGAPIDPMHRSSQGVERRTIGHNQSLFETCRRRETAAMQMYGAAMSSMIMPLMARDVERAIAGHYDAIVATRDHMQRMANVR